MEMESEIIPEWFPVWFDTNFSRAATTPGYIARTAALSKDTVYRALNSGELEAFRVGNRWSIPKPALEKWFLESLNLNF